MKIHFNDVKMQLLPTVLGITAKFDFEKKHVTLNLYDLQGCWSFVYSSHNDSQDSHLEVAPETIA